MYTYCIKTSVTLTRTIQTNDFSEIINCDRIAQMYENDKKIHDNNRNKKQNGKFELDFSVALLESQS